MAQRWLGKLRHLDTNYLWIQEKAAGCDLNFQRVAGVDNGADLFTKTLSWNEIQSHIHKLNSQFVQDKISVDYVGARLAGGRHLTAWTRTDMNSRTRRTTMKGGPVWNDVVARVTADAVSGEILRFRAGTRHNEVEVEDASRVKDWRTYWPGTSSCAVDSFVGCRGTCQL